MDGLGGIHHGSPCDGRPEGLDRFGAGEAGGYQHSSFPLHLRLRDVPVLDSERSCEVRLGEHEHVHVQVGVLNDLYPEVLLLLPAVQAPDVREEDAKLERGLLILLMMVVLSFLLSLK